MNDTLKFFILISFIIIICGINNQRDLKAQTVAVKESITEEKSKTPDNPTIITPAVTDRNSSGAKDEKNTSVNQINIPEIPPEITPGCTDRKTQKISDDKSTPAETVKTIINAENIYDYPEILLNAYKEAYPGTITDVIKGEKDWIIKFTSGNIYYWANGKILPESLLLKSNKYARYSISPYNMNGRSPELYTEDKIQKLRVKYKTPEKNKKLPGVEGGLYRELYGITTKRSAKKLLTEVKLSGHYIKVHKSLAKKIKSIDTKIIKLSKTDPEVRSYLKNILSVQAFNWRNIAGTNRKSNHSFGIAVDVLPKKYRKKILFWSWEQEKNENWMLLPQSSLWVPPDPVVKIFLEEGFIWGGHWDRYDTMHFEYRPELIALFKNIKFD